MASENPLYPYAYTDNGGGLGELDDIRSGTRTRRSDEPEDAIMWFQGMVPLIVPKCDGNIIPTAPLSKRIADEFRSGYFNLSRPLNPNTNWGDDYGSENVVKLQLDRYREGDTLWLLLVPPRHHIEDVYGSVDPVYGTPQFSFAKLAGYQLSCVTAEFKRDPNLGYGYCSVRNVVDVNQAENIEKENEQVRFTMAFDTEGPTFVREAMDFTTDLETYIGIGWRIDALPDNKNLADLVALVRLGTHCWDFDGGVYQ